MTGMTGVNWLNRTLWTGDNLDIMRGMNAETVDFLFGAVFRPFVSRVELVRLPPSGQGAEVLDGAVPPPLKRDQVLQGKSSKGFDMTGMTGVNWLNRTLWTGDNLDIMRGMNAETVDFLFGAVFRPFVSRVELVRLPGQW